MITPPKEWSSSHNHSHHSLLDGISLPDEIIKKAKEKGIKSIAITDHGSCNAHARMAIEGKKHGVKVIYGTEAYVLNSIDDWRKDRESADLEDAPEIDTNSRITSGVTRPASYYRHRTGHLVILATNQGGLENLYRLTHAAYRRGFYGKPRMDKEMLRTFREGLIATSACMGGVISVKCWNLKEGFGSYEDIVREAREFDEIFGRGRFFLELQFNEEPNQIFINEILVRISKETGIPLSVAGDSHYCEPDDWKAQEILYLLRSKKTMSTKTREHTVRQLYIKSAEEMWQTFQMYSGGLDPMIVMEAFQNTLLMDSLIEDFVPDNHQRLPTLKVEDPFKELGEQAIEGLKRLGKANDDEYKKRLLYELKIIREKGFSNYFLVMQKIVSEAKKEMAVGPARGSAGGSLICYCLDITDMDPVAHELIFERFMDPSRMENPDVDVDFENVNKVKEMLRRIYGEENVACLSNYGTFQIKGLLKDLGRVYDVDNKIINDANKKIEKELKALYVDQDKSTIVIKLDDVKRVSPTYNKLIVDYPQIGENVARLYGRNRQVGRHASGVIIGDDLPRETALITAKAKAEDGDDEDGVEEGRILQAAFTEGIVNKDIAYAGFSKFDILSLATLKVISYCLELISKRTGKSIEELKESIRSKNMDLNDPKVLKNIFHDGNFIGVFQFTEKGIQRLAKDVKPETFTDVSAITSLYRPGPLAGGYDKMYVKNKKNPELVSYPHPLLEGILKKTRGSIVFQEQLMQICNQLGMMDWKDVQSVRKVLLKKDRSKTEEFLKSENDRLTKLFLEGCKKNGMEDLRAKELWKDLLSFGSYAFNKSHSDGYSIVSMQCAHLCTYYPLEWAAAVLTMGKAGDLQSYVGAIQRYGIKILPVDINVSKGTHIIENGTIRLSFTSVKGVGPAAIEKIVSNQPYTDFVDFIQRSGATKTAIGPLINAGAFDSICPNMQDLDVNYALYNERKDYKRKTRDKKNPDRLCFEDWMRLFDIENQIEDYPLHKKVMFEYELFGFSLRGSPFEILDRESKIASFMQSSLINQQNSDDEDTYYGIDFDDAIKSDMPVICLPVLCKRVFEKPQRNGQMMAFLTFQTIDGKEFDCPAFSGIWRYINKLAIPGSVLIGTFNRDLEEEPESLVVGRPGFAHSERSATSYMFPVDFIPGNSVV